VSKTVKELQDEARTSGKNVALLIQREDAQIFRAVAHSLIDGAVMDEIYDPACGRGPQLNSIGARSMRIARRKTIPVFPRGKFYVCSDAAVSQWQAAHGPHAHLQKTATGSSGSADRRWPLTSQMRTPCRRELSLHVGQCLAPAVTSPRHLLSMAAFSAGRGQSVPTHGSITL